MVLSSVNGEFLIPDFAINDVTYSANFKIEITDWFYERISVECQPYMKTFQDLFSPADL